jgi:hypothetical protein
VQATTDKASQERKVKQLEAQVAKQAKEIEKKDGLSGKKLDTALEVCTMGSHPVE